MVPTQQNANKRSQAGNVTIGVVPRECAGSRPCWGEGFLFAFFPCPKLFPAANYDVRNRVRRGTWFYSVGEPRWS